MPTFARTDVNAGVALVKNTGDASGLSTNIAAESLMEYFWLTVLGVAIGAYGTLIGAGGGFILMPILILLWPDQSRELLTAISLAVVFFNAMSGSIAYARMKRINYRAGVMFSAAAIPGAIIGVIATPHLPLRIFDGLFGGLMIAAAVFLAFQPLVARQKLPEGDPYGAHDPNACGERRRDGGKPKLSYSTAAGIEISGGVGFISSLFGIGGGIIHVPALVYVLGFPVHMATATSHFVLAFTALAATIFNISRGAFDQKAWMVAPLAVGVVVGAQSGARISARIHGGWIIRGLGAALGIVGIRILARGLFG